MFVTHSPLLAPYGTKQNNLRVEYILGLLQASLCTSIGSVAILKWSYP